MNEKESLKNKVKQIEKLQSTVWKHLGESVPNREGTQQRGPNSVEPVKPKICGSGTIGGKKPGRRNVNHRGPRTKEVRNKPLGVRERALRGLDNKRLRTSGSISGVNQKNNQRLLSRNISNSLSRNFVFDTPMPHLDYEITPIGGIDKLRIRGTEYLTDITVTPTLEDNSSSSTRPGDVIYTIPTNPNFFEGCRFAQMAGLYAKYKWKQLTLEYVPVVPSTQNGTIVFYVSYDPEENVMSTDENERLRRALSHVGAIDTNVYNYARCTLIDDKMLDDYYINIEGDVRFENQGTLNIVAGTAYSPSMLAPTSSSLDLGQLLIHYELELSERMTQDVLPSVRSGVASATSIQISSIWDNYSDLNVPMSWTTSAFNTFLGISPGLHLSDVVILIGTRNLLVGEVTPSDSVFVVSTNTGDQGERFLSKGSVWFAHLDYEGRNTIQFFDNLAAALGNQPGVQLVSALIGTEEMNVAFRWYLYNTHAV